MTKRIERFEDFIAWQKARKLTADIYRVTNEGSLHEILGSRIKSGEPQFPVCRTSPKDSNEEDQPSFTSFFRLQKHLAPSFGLNCMWPWM
jgi:hypothetical protein